MAGCLPACFSFSRACGCRSKKRSRRRRTYYVGREGDVASARRDASHTGLRVWLRHAEADHPSIPSLQPVSCEHSLASSTPVLPGLPHGTVGAATIGVVLVFLRWRWCWCRGVQAARRHILLRLFFFSPLFLARLPRGHSHSGSGVSVVHAPVTFSSPRSARRFIFAPCYVYRAPVASVRGTRRKSPAL